MKKQTLEELTEEVLKLHDDEVVIEEIVNITKTPRYLIESILISHREVYFR